MSWITRMLAPSLLNQCISLVHLGKLQKNTWNKKRLFWGFYAYQKSCHIDENEIRRVFICTQNQISQTNKRNSKLYWDRDILRYLRNNQLFLVHIEMCSRVHTTDRRMEQVESSNNTNNSSSPKEQMGHPKSALATAPSGHQKGEFKKGKSKEVRKTYIASLFSHFLLLFFVAIIFWIFISSTLILN